MSDENVSNAVKFWEENGFEVWDTGGGMEALGMELDDGSQVMITGEQGELPEETTEQHSLGRYNKDGDQVWSAVTFDSANALAIINELCGEENE